MNSFKKSVRIFAGVALGVILLSACSSETHKTMHKAITPYLNQDEFTGLHELSDSVAAVQLDYALDSASGGELPLSSCAEVNATGEDEVDPSQAHLLQLMKVNCTAVGYYFVALKASRTTAVNSEFPDALNSAFIESLPGLAVPDLGGDSMLNRNGTLAEVEPGLKVVAITESSAEVELAGDLVVNYVVMARGDFNQDGFEDLLLRLDWYISTAFGKGFDLIMLSQTPKDKLPKITWRR